MNARRGAGVSAGALPRLSLIAVGGSISWRTIQCHGRAWASSPSHPPPVDAESPPATGLSCPRARGPVARRSRGAAAPSGRSAGRGFAPEGPSGADRVDLREAGRWGADRPDPSVGPGDSPRRRPPLAHRGRAGRPDHGPRSHQTPPRPSPCPVAGRGRSSPGPSPFCAGSPAAPWESPPPDRGRPSWSTHRAKTTVRQSQ
jgi:hypothetical protein